MATVYGPAERLSEQIEILLRDPGATEIVMLSILGEPALPMLCERLDADSRGKRDWDAAIAVIRAIGMSGHPSVVPSLALRLQTFKQERFGRDETEPRAIVNALRKVGNDDALRAIVDNLNRLNLAHTRSILEQFGPRAREVLLAKTGQFDDPSWPHAARLVAAMRVKEAIPLLTHAAATTRDAIDLLAHFGPDAPKEWAVRRLLDLHEEVMHAYLRQRSDGGGYSHHRRHEGVHAEHNALLRLLYHAGDPAVLRPLAPYLAIEHSVGLTTSREEPGASVTLLALAFGELALPHLGDDSFAASPPAVREAANKIRTQIRERFKTPEETQGIKRFDTHDGDGPVEASGFRLPRSPLGDVDSEPNHDPLPGRRSSESLDYDDDY